MLGYSHLRRDQRRRVPKIMVNGETGLLVPMGDVEAMAAAILEIVGNVERAQAMGQAGRARAESHFSIEATARLAEETYGRMV